MRYYAVVLIGRITLLVRPFVRLSVCPFVTYSKTIKKHNRCKRSSEQGNRCASFQFKRSRINITRCRKPDENAAHLATAWFFFAEPRRWNICKTSLEIFHFTRRHNHVFRLTLGINYTPRRLCAQLASVPDHSMTDTLRSSEHHLLDASPQPGFCVSQPSFLSCGPPQLSGTRYHLSTWPLILIRRFINC